MMVCSKSHNNKPIEEFVLVSPAPVDTAAKLSNIYMKLSEKEKERAKDLIAAGLFNLLTNLKITFLNIKLIIIKQVNNAKQWQQNY